MKKVILLFVISLCFLSCNKHKTSNVEEEVGSYSVIDGDTIYYPVDEAEAAEEEIADPDNIESDDDVPLDDSDVDNYPTNNTNYNNYIPTAPQIETDNSSIHEPCRSCHTSGNCPICNGARQVRKWRNTYDGNVEDYYEDCSYCRTTGSCTACGGDGYIDSSDL